MWDPENPGSGIRAGTDPRDADTEDPPFGWDATHPQIRLALSGADFTCDPDAADANAWREIPEEDAPWNP